MKRPGALAIVLHTHMPYVEGFGTWPFGEEWLFEAIATSYLPVLDVLERAASRRSPASRGAGAPITLSLTPVLCDQLQAPGVAERFGAFLRGVRRESHRRRTGEWAGGFWLPECAHAPALDALLADEGVIATCVDLSSTGIDPLRPLRSDAGVILAPLDRAIVELVWSPDGYPSRAPYR